MMLMRTVKECAHRQESLRVKDLAIPSSLFFHEATLGGHGVEKEKGASLVGEDVPSTFFSFLKSSDRPNQVFPGGPSEVGSGQVMSRGLSSLKKEVPISRGEFQKVPLLMDKEGRPLLLREDLLLDVVEAKNPTFFKKVSPSPGQSFQDGVQVETPGQRKLVPSKRGPDPSRPFQDGLQVEIQGPKKEAFLKTKILPFRQFEGDQLLEKIQRPQSKITRFKKDSLVRNKLLDSRENKVESKQGEILKVLKKQTQNAFQSPSVKQSPRGFNVYSEKDSVDIQKFQNHFKDQSLFRPTAQRSEAVLQDTSPQEPPSRGEVVTAKEFLGGPQSQILNTGGQRTPSSQVFDMGNSFHAVDTLQLIERISQYIIQHSVGSTKEIDLSIKHPEIGKFRVNVSQDLGRPGVQLAITAFSREGADFFVLNQVKLLSNLDQSGVKVQDFKLEQQFNGGQYSSSHESHQEAHSQARQDAQRRRQLWEQFSKGMI